MSTHPVNCLHDTLEAVPQTRDIDNAYRKINCYTTTQSDLPESRDKNYADFYSSNVLPISQPTVSKH